METPLVDLRPVRTSIVDAANYLRKTPPQISMLTCWSRQGSGVPPFLPLARGSTAGNIDIRGPAGVDAVQWLHQLGVRMSLPWGFNLLFHLPLANCTESIPSQPERGPFGSKNVRSRKVCSKHWIRGSKDSTVQGN